MNMDFGLYQQQSMKLVMTTELRQAITILQYSTQELVSFLKEQQLENPLLEVKDKIGEETFLKQENVYDTNDAWKVYDGENISPFEFISKNEKSLQDHLLNQITYLSLTDNERKLVKYLTFSLDENGYFTSTLEEVANKLKMTEGEVENGLAILQSLDPVGVGARSLQECLLIQLRQLKTPNIVAEEVVENYLTMFANKKWREIAKALSTTIEEIQEAADCIQSLQPKPGSLFTNELSTYISPDVFIDLIDGELYTSINDNLLPKLSVSRDYLNLIESTSCDTSVKYMQQKHQQILWLLKSINQRQQTLLKVTEAIARHQENFFKYGYEFLKPLTLKEIAAEVDVHESTVSRATTEKYVQTPKGLFELKYFFSSGVKADSGANTSSLSVKEIIKKAIDAENKQKPLSDQKIVTILEKEHGIEIARRTVAKYRDELNIPTSSKRKRFS